MLIETTGRADILEVIADLSNDAVFTPPRVANAVLDLLPEHVWSDPELRWLDPGSKTGVFLREVTRRLMIGLADVLEDEDERLQHILRNQVFGIATESITALISRRTVYCSKTADGPKSIVKMPTTQGNVWFDRIEHSYTKGTCIHCSASKEKHETDALDNYAYALIHPEGRHALRQEIDMKFDVIVGNPPYQMEADSSGKNVVAIYDQFVEQAQELDPQYITMVIPSRWMTAGRGLEDFREQMLSGGHLRTIVDYPNSAELFPTVDIKSGICYFLWSRDDVGKCAVTTSRGGETYGPTERELDEFDVLVRDSRALPILRKVLSAGDPSIAGIVSTRDPFGPTLGSNFKGFRSDRREGDVRLVMNQETTQREIWVERSTASRNEDLIDVWKVFVPKAGPGNSGGHVIPDSVLSKPAVAGPGSVCSATYLVVGPLESEVAAENAAAYIRTRFARFLVSLRKPSQNSTRDSYMWVPQQAWDHEWTDAELFAKYGITDEEQEYIAQMIREMPA